MLKNLLFVGLGSCLGGMLRYCLSKWVLNLFPMLSFPLGTFLVNVVGCFFIGLFGGCSEQGGWLGPSMKLFLTVGLCGGFTTFSTFLNENSQFVQNGQFGTCFLYTVSSLFVGLIFLYAGRALSEWIFP
ncbi:MAG: fluoride efflux transporter CrcB [Phocaeicola plebeius]